MFQSHAIREYFFELNSDYTFVVEPFQLDNKIRCIVVY